MRNTSAFWFTPLVLLAAAFAALAASAGEATGPSNASGPFQPTWESLTKCQCPDWFPDAKFGIWAHRGPQCVPMMGDWYARHMYVQGASRSQYEHHMKTYGHPSKFAGCKPVFRSEFPVFSRRARPVVIRVQVLELIAWGSHFQPVRRS